MFPPKRLQRDRVVGQLGGLATAAGSELAISLSAPVDDEDESVEPRGRLGRDLLEPRGRPELVGDGRRDDLRLSGGVRLDLGVHPVADVGRQRHLESDDHHEQRVGEGREQPGAQAHGCSRPRRRPENRKPTPRTVWM